MKILVTYKSKTGYTRMYSEIIAEELDCTLMDLRKVTAEKMSAFDLVIFGGGLYRGRINGLKKAKEMLNRSTAKKLVVFATGATPNAEKEVIEGVWKDNLTQEELKTIPHFYMQSGLCYEKMSFTDKILMKGLATMLKNKKDKNSFEKGLEEAIKSSYDISSKEFAEPLVNYFSQIRN
ncbi:MAG: flavodoxin domain-containing protein [Acetivibrionales bacterium]|jgi:menaquinone-dependent protoporphyrinogen IX oxidase